MRKLYEPGMKFGCHTLIRRAPERSKASWIAKCDCGVEVITNASAIARNAPECHHNQRVAGKKFGDFKVTKPLVVTAKNIHGSCYLEGACKKCGNKRSATASAWERGEGVECKKCKSKARCLFETDTHISIKKAMSTRGISKQRIHQIIDSGRLDAEDVGRFMCIIKNEKWDIWKSGKKWSQPSYPDRKTVISIGDIIGSWTVIGRDGQKWVVECKCGARTSRSGMMKTLSKNCCHIEKFKAGVRLGRLTVCNPLKITGYPNKKVHVRCDCGHDLMMLSTHAGSERWRNFMRCKRCKKEYGS